MADEVTLSHKQIVMVSNAQTNKSSALTPSILIPTISFSAEEVVNQILDNGRRGPHAMDFRAAAGTKLVNITIEAVVQSDPGVAIGFGLGTFLQNIMGSSSTEDQLGTSSVWNHDYLLKDPPAIEYLTIEENLGVSGSNDRRFIGCRVQEIVFAWNAGEGVLTYNVTLTGREVTLVTATDLGAQATTIEDALEGWTANVAFNGSINYGTPAFTKLISAEWTLSRAVSVLYTGQDSQLPHEIFLGPLACTVALVINYEDDTELALFRAGTEVKITNSFVRSRTGGTALRRFIIGNSTFSLLDAPVTIDTSGENATIAVAARALYNTDVSEIIADVSVSDDGAAPTNTGPVQVRLTDLRNTVFS